MYPSKVQYVTVEENLVQLKWSYKVHVSMLLLYYTNLSVLLRHLVWHYLTPFKLSKCKNTIIKIYLWVWIAASCHGIILWRDLWPAFAQFDGRAGPGFHTSFMARLLLHDCITTICNLVHNAFVTLVLAFDPPTHYKVENPK